ncbi:MAG: proteasome assembly chaperone family protein [Candidatus Heimdallarchaeota archaeon]
MSFQVFLDSDSTIIESADTIICGFHGLGEVGWIACRHLIDTLDLERCGVVQSTSAAPPFISLEGENLCLPFELYGRNKGPIVFLSRLQPYRHAQVEFSLELANWINDNFQNGFFIGGVDARLRNSESDLRYIPTRALLAEKGDSKLNIVFQEIRDHVLEPGLFVTGPLAVVMGHLDLLKFPGLGILAYAERERPDPIGAANAIKKVGEILDTEISVEELQKNAEEVQEQIQQHLLAAQSAEPERTDEKRPPIYT